MLQFNKTGINGYDTGEVLDPTLAANVTEYAAVPQTGEKPLIIVSPSASVNVFFCIDPIAKLTANPADTDIIWMAWAKGSVSTLTSDGLLFKATGLKFVNGNGITKIRSIV